MIDKWLFRQDVKKQAKQTKLADYETNCTHDRIKNH